MKRHKYDDRDMRDRRRKQVLRRIQDEEWKEQEQGWKADEEDLFEEQGEEIGDG
jgi:hypothetical protein